MSLLHVLLDLTDKLDVFANHLSSSLLIYLILMSKRIHLIQKYVVFKGNPTLPRLLNFEEFPTLHPHLLSLEECFNPPSPLITM